ncbi:paramyosin-like [Coffea eugenioides]|uniref:paramyosin-like n=1 Tax=Coffea eugenioides TaxID=49369 RepID=UPI000F610CA6|nr:paramyosin-like [Coffea eugenioides]
MSNNLMIITDEKEELRRHKDLRISELEEELTEKIYELEACMRENAGLESQNNSLASQVDILSKENGSLSSKMKRLNDEVADSKTENKRLNDELQRENDHLNEDLMGKYKIIHNKLQLHCDELERDSDELKHSLEEQKGAVDIIEEEETNIQLLFGCLIPKFVSYFDVGVAFLAFGIECCLISLGEGDDYKSLE